MINHPGNDQPPGKRLFALPVSPHAIIPHISGCRARRPNHTAPKAAVSAPILKTSR